MNIRTGVRDRRRCANITDNVEALRYISQNRVGQISSADLKAADQMIKEILDEVTEEMRYEARHDDPSVGIDHSHIRKALDDLDIEF